MKSATASIHLAALATCFMAHLAFAAELDGVRRAIETMKGGGQARIEMPVAGEAEA